MGFVSDDLLLENSRHQRLKDTSRPADPEPFVPTG
jgi:hypothetical protein